MSAESSNARRVSPRTGAAQVVISEGSSFSRREEEEKQDQDENEVKGELTEVVEALISLRSKARVSSLSSRYTHE